MSILDAIFEFYLTGDLPVQPENLCTEYRPKLLKLVEKFNLNEEQASDLDDFLIDTVDSEGKKYFYAGFKLAMELMSEVSAKSEINSEV